MSSRASKINLKVLPENLIFEALDGDYMVPFGDLVSLCGVSQSYSNFIMNDAGDVFGGTSFYNESSANNSVAVKIRISLY